MYRNVEPSAIFLQAFTSVIRSFAGSSSRCFEALTALRLTLMLSFYRINLEPIDQVKNNLSFIFPNAAILLQTNHPKSAHNSEKGSLSTCADGRALVNFFLWPPLAPK